MAICLICNDHRRLTEHGLKIHMGKIHDVHYQDATIYCMDCGREFRPTSMSMKRCDECRVLRWRTPAPHPERVCVDCGLPFVAHTSRQRRCHDCSVAWEENAGLRSSLIRMIRRDFAIKARVNPQSAKQILERVQREDGKEFVNMLLDGIFEKAENDPVGFSRPWLDKRKKNSRKCRKCGHSFMVPRKSGRLETHLCPNCKKAIARDGARKRLMALASSSGGSG